MTIVSNGNYAPKETFQKYLITQNYSLGIVFLKFVLLSLNTCDESEYESLMGLKFRKTIDNLNWIHSYFRALEVKPNIRLSRVSTSPGGDMNFIQYCSKNFPDFKLKLLKLNDWAGENPLLEPTFKILIWKVQTSSVASLVIVGKTYPLVRREKFPYVVWILGNLLYYLVVLLRIIVLICIEQKLPDLFPKLNVVFILNHHARLVLIIKEVACGKLASVIFNPQRIYI